MKHIDPRVLGPNTPGATYAHFRLRLAAGGDLLLKSQKKSFLLLEEALLDPTYDYPLANSDDYGFKRQVARRLILWFKHR